ncbi:MAG: valine--tRNA ligase [Bacteroidota bacterium]|nr:valine--tRNA ligase [Bacteroidota bacterium]
MISSKYIPSKIEEKWYRYWIQNNFFKSIPDKREAYTIVIPPPNVTGILHIGHMMNNTIQDVLIRKARMNGYNACWVPGTDHASIATEAKVVSYLKEKGISKKELSRNEFLEHAWKWTNKHGGIIINQLKKLGCSCDWDRTKFTLDKQMSESVTKVFIDLYEEGLIYKGHRMVNWDPDAQTTLSDEEIFFEESKGKLYHISYKICESEENIIIATTRPETIFGDTAIAVNPNDNRYSKLIGKRAIVPIVNRTIPIIADEYVSMELGTGCLKVTPAHDENDYKLAQKHNLNFIDIFNSDGTLNNHGLSYEGLDRFDVRNKLVTEFKKLDILLETKEHRHKLSKSERTNSIIEPRFSEQWFLKMDKISNSAFKSISNNDIKLFPKKFINFYNHWLENIRDWNISRQLWWGHQIPVYYYGKDKKEFVVAENKQMALKKAILNSGNKNLKIEELKQDDDVLDTWFSSWIWPISVFNGILEPNNEDIKYYYPTNDLVTGPDILFFWVARMIMSGYHLKNQKPFSNVYLTGLIRDSQGRKMSKQLGNSPDAVQLMVKYGSDAVRVGLLLCAPAGNDLLYDENLCKQGKNFANKIWNSYRLIESWKPDNKLSMEPSSKIAIDWYESKYNKTLSKINDEFKKFRISHALMEIYKLIWDDFCSWFLEIIKPEKGKIDNYTYKKVKYFFERNLKILHPFMPFISEEIWHLLEKRNTNESLIISSWPKENDVDKLILEKFEYSKELISQIRSARKNNSISFKDSIKLICSNQIDKELRPIVEKMGNVNDWTFEVKDAQIISFRVLENEYSIPVKNSNFEEEVVKITKELHYLEGLLNLIDKKLSNQKFINNAPKSIIEKEKKKAFDTKLKIENLSKSLKNLKLKLSK